MANGLRISPKQMKVLTWWQKGDWEAIICDGAVRSGKTFAMGLSFFLWAERCFDGKQFGLCGKTIGSLRRNLLSELVPYLRQMGMNVRERRSENLLIVQYKGHENRFLLFGGRDESSAALIQGSTLAGILMDEAALMPRSFVEQACARCSVVGSKMWFNCNPASPEHWFFKEWIQKAEQKHMLHLHFTMQDNPGLTEAVRQRYERLYTGVFYRRYILGQWCQAEGLVYDLEESRFVCHAVPAGGRYYISVDYGTQNPFSAGLWCVNQGVAYRVREFYHNGREKGCLTDGEYYQALEDLAGNETVEAVIVDPSAASFITLIRRKGQFRVRKAKNGVLPGIRLATSLLHSGKVKIFAGCGDILREFRLYRWEDGADVPVKENDHAMDDMRYFCATVMARVMDN